MLRHAQRGDTIVEVLFAVAIFSLIVVGALSLMSQGSAASQRALETTLVRQQIDAQAETLRYMHSAYVARYEPGASYQLTNDAMAPEGEWYKMMQYVAAAGLTEASTYGYCPQYANTETGEYTPARGSFVLDTTTSRVLLRSQFPSSQQAPSTWAQLDTSTATPTAYGLWIEAVRSSTSADPYQSSAGYVDFHIRACWDSPGLQTPMTLGTIVRLYEPRG